MEYGYKENYTYKDFVDLISHQNYSNEYEFEKAMIPIFNLMFGWPLSDLEVQKSVKVNRTRSQILDLEIKNAFVVDFKGPGENLEKKDYIDQLSSYLKLNKLSKGLLISPDSLLLYDEDAEEIVASFPLNNDDIEFQHHFLELLRYDNNRNYEWDWVIEHHKELELDTQINLDIVAGIYTEEEILERNNATHEDYLRVIKNRKANPNYYIKTETPINRKANPNNYMKTETPEISKPATKQRAVYRSSGDDGEGKPRDILYDLVVNNYDKLKDVEWLRITPTKQYAGTNLELPDGKYLNINYSRADLFKKIQKIKDFLGI